MFLVCFLIIFLNFRHILDHRFNTPERNGTTFQTKYPSDLKPSKRIHEQDIRAVQKRFLEVFVRQKPILPAGALPSCGQFKRDHLIVGLFFQVLRTLYKYDKHHFNSDYMYLYCLSGLSKNIGKLKLRVQNSAKKLIINLFTKYQLDKHQIASCLTNLDTLEENDPSLTLENIETF